VSAAAIVFAFFMALSIAVALVARIGVRRMDIGQYLVAGRSLPAFVIFFLAVGEIYSIGTMIGLPSGIYAKGASYGIWFLCYILLAYPVGYFLAPLIWRAGRKYNAMTVPDAFEAHFRSRGLGVVVAIASIVALVPWGQYQFLGLEVVLGALGFRFTPSEAVVLAGIIAFIYIAVSGVRAPAFVAFLKDTFMLAGIVIVGLAAVHLAPGGVPGVFHMAAVHHASFTMSGSALIFAVSTILFQAFGFFLGGTGQFIFPARSEAAIKSSMTWMPLYMLMYPFLVFASYYAVATIPHLKNPNTVFMVEAVRLLPSALVGVVAAGAGLSGVLVLAAVALSIGAIVSRNLVPHVPPEAQRRWTVAVIAVFLVAAALITIYAPTLMLTVLNVAYYIWTQFGIGWMLIFFARRVCAEAVAAGIVVGCALAIVFYVAHVTFGGLNIGLVALAANLAVTLAVSFALPAERTEPIAVRAQYIPGATP
jgi:SSS family solute:Na+ symporter